MRKLEKIKEIITTLNKASTAYYKYDKPVMTDKQYDDLYDELLALEKDTNIILSNSPTQNVSGEVIESLQKIPHTRPMLSANKTKDMKDVCDFISKNRTIESWKLDGLTIVSRYENGVLKQAITRGNGEVGEDVTHTFKTCINLPLQLSEPVNIEVRGECVISWESFNRLNESLEDPYSHPRNLAAGTVRQLDSNVAKTRCLEYIVFELVQDNLTKKMDVIESFEYLKQLGFDVVEYKEVDTSNFESVDKECFEPEYSRIPVDGTIYKYDSYDYGLSLGVTSHHPLNMLARKWTDDLYETTITDIEWNTTRTGTINPVAIFNEVSLDNCLTTRATLHNVSYIEDLKLGIGDKIRVYRANGVIPKVHDNLTQTNNLTIPKYCPSCGGGTEIHNENGSKTLHCINQNCNAKLIDKMVHFVSRNGTNINGLSDETLKKLISLDILHDYSDIYSLKNHRDIIVKVEGFGTKLVDKLLKSIEDSRQIKLENFIYALGIEGIGRTQSKIIAKTFNHDWYEFEKALIDGFMFTSLDGFGSVLHFNIHEWYKNRFISESVNKLISVMDFQKPIVTVLTDDIKDLTGLTFVITGSLHEFENRDAVKEEIESKNGKVSGSVSAKTNYLDSISS